MRLTIQEPRFDFVYVMALGSEVETLMYIEKQRRRINVLSFAAIDKVSGKMAGVLAYAFFTQWLVDDADWPSHPCRLGCDPLQATLDVKILGIKIFPCYRGSHVFVHACYLLLGYVLDLKEAGGLGLVRVGWRTPPENVRSQKAAEKLGFSREGIMR
jgi:RimJ/RimL family protein N-acetyltransferase